MTRLLLITCKPNLSLYPLELHLCLLHSIKATSYLYRYLSVAHQHVDQPRIWLPDHLYIKAHALVTWPLVWFCIFGCLFLSVIRDQKVITAPANLWERIWGRSLVESCRQLSRHFGPSASVQYPLTSLICHREFMLSSLRGGATRPLPRDAGLHLLGLGIWPVCWVSGSQLSFFMSLSLEDAR